MQAEVNVKFPLDYSHFEKRDYVIKCAAEYIFKLPDAHGTITFPDGEIAYIGKEIKQ